ncbi:MAG: Rab family GTPase [Bacteroidota bacterium]
MLSKKVILTGSFGVGKTSLFNQFVFSKFSDKYLTTIGVKVNKKVISVGEQDLSILLWDIAGEVAQDKVPVSYFMGADGVIFVFDLTRPTTFEQIKRDLDYLRNILPKGTIKVVGNKKDLVTEEHIQKTLESLDVECDYLTSAKTGENVELLFLELGAAMLRE